MSDSQSPIYLVLLGAPGAGKGTQAVFLAEELSVAHVASGDLFREALAKQTELGQLAKSFMDRGELVPDDVTIAMVMERLAMADCAGGAILDGFPRTIDQAVALEKALGEKGHGIALVPYVKVSEDVLLARLAGRWTCRNCGAIYHQLFSPSNEAGVCDECGGELFQRSDDTPETQKHRIQVYFEQTSPLIEFFRQRKVLIEIDGEQTVEDVRLALLGAIARVRSGGSF
jgi:adenylate kinase